MAPLGAPDLAQHLVNYRRYADQKLLPALGRLPLNRVDTATIDRFYAELRQRGSNASTATGAYATATPRCVPARSSGCVQRRGARPPDQLRPGHPHDPKRHPRRPCSAVGRLQAGHGVGLDQPQPGPADHPAGRRAARHPAARGRPGRAAHRDGHGRGPANTSSAGRRQEAPTATGPAPPAATSWPTSGASSPPCCARPPPPAFRTRRPPAGRRPRPCGPSMAASNR